MRRKSSYAILASPVCSAFVWKTVSQEVALKKKYLLVALIMTTSMPFLPLQAGAATCANGAYNAGCVGPNGGVIVRKAPPPLYAHPRVYGGAPIYAAPRGRVTCVNGVYRAGCAGPNGAAVVRKAY